uniref:Evasin n=1 Tax=Ixodes ricinus TaxID=34613 RepID=A0A0K8R9S9_IXORI
MLSLKLTLVVLILEIGERALCADPCPMAAGSSEVGLDPSSLLDTPDNEKCNYKVLADLNHMDFLIVNCTKDCQDGKRSTVTDGQSCIVMVTKAATPDEVTVSVGLCHNGTCDPKGDPDCRTITLPKPGDDDEEDEDEEEEDDEEDEEEDDE